MAKVLTSFCTFLLVILNILIQSLMICLVVLDMSLQIINETTILTETPENEE